MAKPRTVATAPSGSGARVDSRGYGRSPSRSNQSLVEHRSTAFSEASRQRGLWRNLLLHAAAGSWQAIFDATARQRLRASCKY